MIHQTGYEAGVYSQKLTLERDAEMLKTIQAAGVEVIYPDTGPFPEESTRSLLSIPGMDTVCTKPFNSNCNSINAQRPASSLLGRTRTMGGFMRLLAKWQNLVLPLRYSFWLW